MSKRKPLSAMAVIIPAHNEEHLLTACLAAVDLAVFAARDSKRQVEVWVALDSCDDKSAEIAHAAGVKAVTVDARNVGIARQAAASSALQHFAELSPEQVWLAHTDADSVVPPNWLTHQAALARKGADVVVGTVRPDFRDLSEQQTEAWWHTHMPGVANGHVHGANLGTRASAFLTAGGFQPVPLHEDVYLVEAARRAGARIEASDAAWVQTSGRQVGRAPGGYADYLKGELLPLAKSL